MQQATQALLRPFVMLRILLLVAALIASSGAFSTSFLGQSRIAAPRSCSSLQMRVVDIDSEDAFDKTIKSADGALVIVDYSTTWCGPCKVIAPKFDELSDKYPQAVFLKVRYCFLEDHSGSHKVPLKDRYFYARMYQHARWGSCNNRFI